MDEQGALRSGVGEQGRRRAPCKRSWPRRPACQRIRALGKGLRSSSRARSDGYWSAITRCAEIREAAIYVLQLWHTREDR